MDSLINTTASFFNGSTIFNFISFLIAIISLILAIYFFIKGKKNKAPKYSIRTINLIRGNINKFSAIEILFHQDKINNLSVSKLAFWNDGKETINRDDIAPKSPLLIQMEEDFEILDAEIIFQKNLSSNFNLSVVDKTKIAITFDYIDPEDGVIVQILHTANSSSQMQVIGTIKSVKEIARAHYIGKLLPNFLLKILTMGGSGSQKSINYQKRRFRFGLFFLVSGITFICMFVYQTITHKNLSINLKGGSEFIALVIGGVFYTILGLGMLKKRMPSGFHIFDDSI